MKRYTPLLFILSILVTSSLPAMAHRQNKGTITGFVHTRERARQDDSSKDQESLLIGINAPSGGVDEVEFKLDAKWNYTDSFLMPGWNLTRDGKRVTAQGPSNDQFRLRLDFDVSFTGKDRLVTRLGEELKVEARRDGETVFKEDIPVTQLPRVEIGYSLDGALHMPYKLTPGEPFLATTNESFTGGTWAMGVDGKIDVFDVNTLRGGETNARRDPSDIKTSNYTGILARSFFAEAQYSERFFGISEGANTGTPTPKTPLISDRFEIPPGVVGGFVPEGATPGDSLRFNYFDEWGELLVDAKADQIQIVPGLSHTNCPPTMTGSAPRVFEGNPLCICGCFIDASSWFSLNFDGKPIGAPAAASSSTIVYRIPTGTPPGEHTISWHKAAESASGEVKFLVLKVVGTIKQNELWTGQSTRMTLRVEGTEEQMPLEIENKTPTVIEIEGGAKQVINTSGGADNKIERNVRGIHRGNFKIDFKLDEAPCPCPEQSRGQQPPSGDASGKVTDESGEALPGSTINIVNTRTGETRVAITDAQGQFRFLNLPPGEYKMKTSLEGFNTVEQPVNIGSGGSSTVTTTLSVATQAEEIIVTSESPIIDNTLSLKPQACDSIQGRVPEAAIKDALANPREVSGFGELANPNLPASATNGRRTFLSLRDTTKPYHPLYNPLVYKASCP